MKKFFVLFLSLLMCTSICACGSKADPVTVAKTREDIEAGAGTALSDDDAAKFDSIVKDAAAKKDWLTGVVSDSIPSCYLKIGEDIYTYSDMGVLDDQTNFKSLTLKDAELEAMNTLLAAYVDLSLAIDPIESELIPLN